MHNLLVLRQVRKNRQVNIADLVIAAGQGKDVSQQLTAAFDNILEDDTQARELAAQIANEAAPVDDQGRRKPLTPAQAEALTNTALSRARAKESLKRWQERGTKYMQVKAYIDARTTEICKQMNGRIFKIADFKEDETGIVPDVATWAKNDYYRGVPTTDVPARMAPYHHNCRTVMVPYTQPAGQESQIKDKLFNYELKKQDALKATELAVKAKWPKKSAIRHFAKHGRQVKASSLADYNQLINNLIRRAGRDLVLGVDTGSDNLIGYYIDGKLVAVVDLTNGNIITCYRIDKADLMKKISRRNYKYVEMPFKGVTKAATSPKDATIEHLMQQKQECDYIHLWSWAPKHLVAYKEPYEPMEFDDCAEVREHLQRLFEAGKLTPDEIAQVAAVDREILTRLTVKPRQINLAYGRTGFYDWLAKVRLDEITE